MCTSNKTSHNHTCQMAFGRPSKHNDCPRCNELKEGATPRKSWISPQQKSMSVTSQYCFSVAIYHPRCTKETNPNCACGKMSYTD